MALEAGDVVGHYDPVADFEIFYASSDSGDNARQFVPQRNGAAQLRIDFQNIGTAEPAGFGRNKYFPVSYPGLRNFFEDDLSKAFVLQGFHKKN
jgi:hypothetical protein